MAHGINFGWGMAMTETVTYFSQNHINPNEAWSAYVILPTGKRWGVVAFGETEQQAVDKIVSLYEAEKLKATSNYQKAATDFNNTKENLTTAKAFPIERLSRGHHFAGKVWMIHSFTKAKQRVNPDEVAKYEAEGWIKGGPRSK